jgi:nucleoid-associated protein YgaU
MTLKDTYQAVLAVATRQEDLRFDEREGKLQITGVVATEEQKNRIWAAIRTVPAWQREVVVNLRVQPKSAAAKTSSRAGASGARGASQTHTVVAGDTLSAIAERYFGDARQTTKILDANRDLLVNPEKIRPGQVLRIPA